MNKVLSRLGEWLRFLLKWLKNLLTKPIRTSAEEHAPMHPAEAFEVSSFDTEHIQDEFKEASMGGGRGGPSQAAPAQDKKQDLKHNVAKPKTPAPPRR